MAEDAYYKKGTVLVCPECGYELTLVLPSRGVTCSQGQSRVTHKTVVMTPRKEVKP